MKSLNHINQRNIKINSNKFISKNTQHTSGISFIRNLTKLILILVLFLFVIQITYAETTYDFSNLTDKKGYCVKNGGSDTPANPGNILYNEWNNSVWCFTNYNNLATYDSNRDALGPTGPGGTWANAWFNFTINDVVSTISTLRVQFVGYDTLPNGDDFEFDIWNFTSGAWVVINTTTTAGSSDITWGRDFFNTTHNLSQFISGNKLYLGISGSKSMSGPDTPFLYAYDGKKYEYVDEFLKTFNSKEKEGVDYQDITDDVVVKNGKIKLKITEEKKEVSYINRIYLRIDENDSTIVTTNNRPLKYLDNNYFIMDKGDSYYLEFSIPKNYRKIEFVSEGYYIPKHTIYVNYIKVVVNPLQVPTVTTVSPSDLSENVSDPVIQTFNCSATDTNGLTNITLYLLSYAGGNDTINLTTSISGTSNSTTWTRTLASGTYQWYCGACNSLGNCDVSAPARTLYIGNELYDCRTLGYANTYYYLQNSVSKTGTCFTMGGNNITLNLNQYTISGTASLYGVYSTFNYTNLLNGTIYNFNYAVYYNGAHYGTIQKISLTGASPIGIGIVGNNNQISDITSNGNSYPIYFLSSQHNTLSGFNVTNGYFGPYFSGAFNNSVKDGIVSNMAIKDAHSLFGGSTYAINNSIVNVTLIDSNVTAAAGSNMFKKWYYKAYVNDTNGNPVNQATVLGYDKNNVLQFNLTTDATGWTNIYEIIDYNQNGTTKIYYSNYTLNASKTSYTMQSHSLNITTTQNKLNDYFTFPVSPLNCSTLNQSNTVYTLSSNLTTTGTCFTVQANNITINFNGYSITGDAGTADYGISSVGYNFTVIKNGFIYNFGRGIHLTNNQNNTITNMTINSNANYGIYMQYGINNTIIDCTTNSNNNHGVWLHTNSNYNLVKNIIANSNGWYGIYVSNNANNNIIQNNTLNSNLRYGISVRSEAHDNNISANNIWNCSTGGAYACIEVEEANYNIFDGNNINLSAVYGIWIESSGSTAIDTTSHNIFINTNMTNIAGTSVVLDDDIGSQNLNNTFINFTYFNETVDVNSSLIRKWYYRAYVNYTNGTVVTNVIVAAYNVSGSMQFNTITDVNGYITQQEIIDYVNYGGTKSYYSNYTLTANKTGYITQIHSLNITTTQNKINDYFTLTSLPIITSLQFLISPVDLNPGTIKDVYIVYNVTDLDGYADINISTTKVYLTKTGETTRSNITSCNYSVSSTTSLLFNCTVSHWFYDGAGIWNINVSIKDNSNNYVENSTQTYTVNILDDFLLNESTLNCGILNVSTNDVRCGTLTLINRGNQNYNLFNDTAYNLDDDLTGTYIINANTFSVNITDSAYGNGLANGVAKTVTGATLSRGISSTLALYYYIDVPTGLPVDNYNSQSNWLLEGII